MKCIAALELVRGTGEIELPTMLVYTPVLSTWTNDTTTVVGNNIPPTTIGKYAHILSRSASAQANINILAKIPKIVDNGYYSFNWAWYGKASMSGNAIWNASVRDARYYPNSRRFLMTPYWQGSDMTMSNQKLADNINHVSFPFDIILPDKKGWHKVYENKNGFWAGDYNNQLVNISIDHTSDVNNILIKFSAYAYGEERDYAEAWMTFYPPDVTVPHPEAFAAIFVNT